MISNIQTIRERRMLWSLDIIELNKRISDINDQDRMLADMNKFGYEIRRGIIRVKTAEASIVKEIYTAYSKGMSYRQITDHLNAQPVQYNEPGQVWNKNMVARILSGKLYTGNESYPAILSDEEYRRAVSAKPVTGSPLDAKAKVVRQLARCAVCGSTLALSGNKYGWARWNCPSCDAISKDAVMPDTIDALLHILATAIRKPELKLFLRRKILGHIHMGLRNLIVNAGMAVFARTQASLHGLTIASKAPDCRSAENMMTVHAMEHGGFRGIDKAIVRLLYDFLVALDSLLT